eukprot:CAMPEP_0197072858 /NCGR_PEP_ID=MMETSP1384-20130603/210307_1 /TAXON_ID=29189 /ORGANISM="Ammonia sp." /LENGTH=683 /DNA_ID=CAMNT_0042511679 /DNA_START=46 /DNA_END=2097 /DNA_ORIENTATION=-
MKLTLFTLCSVLLFSAVCGYWSNWDASSSESDSGDSNSGSPSTTDTADTEEDEAAQTAPSNAELCGCYEIDLVCTPFANAANMTCYYYTMSRVSNNSYCDSLQFISLGTGNLTECGLPANHTDAVLLDYAPKCYAFDPSYNGSLNNGGSGIQIWFDDGYDATYGSSSSSSSDSDTSGSTYSSSSSSSEDETVQQSSGGDDATGFIVFSVCFDAAAVDGTQETGQIEFQLGENTATCEHTNVLPNFCGSSTEDDPAEDTPSPTTTSPTTASPTTAVPTTASPTTASPTTSAPTTAAPTTTSPTTAQPTTAAPTTVAPTTTAPTTAAPTTVAPTTAAPTTSEPTISPTFSVCDSDDALNVAFILDESGSVDETEWGVITDFVDRVTQYDLSPISYVSLFEYASLANYDQFLDWTAVETAGDRSAVTTALNANNYNPAGQTETWDAVNRVLDNYWDYRFSCTDGCETRSDLLFLVTDGEPTGHEVCPDMIPRMNQSAVDVVIILIDPNGVLDETKVSCLDYQDNEVDVIKLPSFDSDAFNAIEGHIRNKTCSGLYPVGPGERPENGSQWSYNGTVGLGPIPTRGGGGGGGELDPLYMNDDVVDENGVTADTYTIMGVSWLKVVIGATILIVLMSVVGGILCFVRQRMTVKRMILSQVDVVETHNDKEVEIMEGNDSVAMNVQDDAN